MLDKISLKTDKLRDVLYLCIVCVLRWDRVFLSLQRASCDDTYMLCVYFHRNKNLFYAINNVIRV